MFGVADESDATKLAAQADAKVAAAKEKTDAAETAKKAIPTADLATADVAKLDFLAEVAINCQTVKKVVATLDAADATTACDTTFTKTGLTSDDGLILVQNYQNPRFFCETRNFPRVMT